MDCGMKGFQRDNFCPIFQRVEVLRTVEKYLYELRGFKMAEPRTQQLTEFDPNFNVGFVRLNFCIKPIIRSSLFMSIILLRFAFIWNFFDSMCVYPTTGLDKKFIMKTYFNIYFLATSKRQLFTQTDWVWDTSNNPNKCHSKKCWGKTCLPSFSLKQLFVLQRQSSQLAGQDKRKSRWGQGDLKRPSWTSEHREGRGLRPQSSCTQARSPPALGSTEERLLDSGGSKY